MQPITSSTHGISLLETLVVIAVVATLSAILMPAFVSARTAVKLARSKGNMRQLLIGLKLYDADHSDEATIALPRNFNSWLKANRIPNEMMHTGGTPAMDDSPGFDVYVTVWPADPQQGEEAVANWKAYLRLTNNNPVILIDETFPGIVDRGPFVKRNRYGIFWDGGIRKRVYAGLNQQIETYWR